MATFAPPDGGLRSLADFRATRRRFLAGAAAVIGAGVASPATGLSRGAQDVPEVVFWTSFTGDVEVNALRQIVDAFNQQQQAARAKLVQVPGESETDVAKLMTAVRGGVGPDVYLFNRPFAIQRAADGVLQDLTPFLDTSVEDLASQYLEFAFNECRYEDGLYALPFDTDARALYYRRDLLQEAGIDPAELEPANGPLTIDRVHEIAAGLDQKNGDGQYTRIGFVPWFAQGWHYTWGYAFGGEFYDPENCQVTPTNEGVARAFQYLHDRAAALGPEEAQSFLSPFLRPDSPPAQNPFYNGQLAFMVSGDWEIALMQEYAPDVDYGITYIPVPTEGDAPSSWSAGFSVVMPQGAKNPEGAIELMRFMAGEPGQRIYTTATQHFPTLKALVDDESLYDPRHRFFSDVLDFSRSLPSLPVGALLWDELTAAQEKVTLHESTPEEALQEVESRVQSQLDRYC